MKRSGMSTKKRIKDGEIVQDRARMTREKLFVSALGLYIKKGYHNTTVDEIAENAGLSTGIAYRYFKNKKELLLATLEYCFLHVGELTGTSGDDLYEDDLEAVLSAFEKLHEENRDFHEELEGLRHSDEDVRKLYEGFASKALSELYDNLPGDMKNKPHSWEKLHISIGLMENYCHAYMDHALGKKELSYMRKEVLKIVRRLMTED